jgi:uncharacterized damage-inducible protein DinB
MAEYNQWMNVKVYEACAKLTASQLAENRQAFFGSVVGTLNHLVVADIIWLKRLASATDSCADLDALAQLPMPESLNTILYADLVELSSRRQVLDQMYLSLTRSLTEEDLKQIITYTNLKGISSSLELFSLLAHVFNHQTHHRGQTTTLLSQFGVDVGITDLLALILSR